MKHRRFGSGWNRMNDVDPLIGLTNLSDVMLVFACGLMLALVVRWNVNLNPQNLETSQVQEIAETDMISEEHLEGERFQSEGTVYRDTQTDRLYIIKR